MDDAAIRKTKVRIVCTVPRRIAAITISDRVASERGERVGQTVGYQIRLESCISPCDTLLTYCTSGILLRSLTSFDYSILKNTTHIIIDEVHERDRQTEFLLACVRDVGAQFPNLKLILMGADMDTKLMTSYFGGSAKCPLIEVHGRLYPVETIYLEDILGLVQGKSQNSQQQNWRTRSSNSNPNSHVFDNIVNALKHPVSRKFAELDNLIPTPFSMDLSMGRVIEPIRGRAKEENTVILGAEPEELDAKVMNMWQFGDDTEVLQFIGLVEKQGIPVNYQHSHTNATMLMACTVRGRRDYVEKLLSLGADPCLFMVLEDGRRYTARNWALDHKQLEIAKLIEQCEYSRTLLPSTFSTSSNLPADVKERLDRYQTSRSDDRVDLQLIIDLLYRIHTYHDLTEAVLVFLPGYEDIVNLKQMIFTDRELGNFSHDLTVFLLHSNIQSGDQRAVFEPAKRGRRKIVLSTNIAETSLTIEDIVFVIDSGKVKEKSFDSITGVSQLRANWISKASANQRQGRAGRCRPGMCVFNQPQL